MATLSSTASTHALKADSVNMVVGVLNGTTNFILSKMEGEGADFGTVLKEAQDLGYAEADPTADVEGHDVRSKISTGEARVWCDCGCGDRAHDGYCRCDCD